MKIGVLGDIHGNSRALAAVLDCARRENVERLLVTGDLVGYYFDPAAVLRMLGSWNVVMARGNHEDMLALVRADASQLPQISRKYGSGVAIALEALSVEELDLLCGLPHPVSVELDHLRMLLCHGAPWNVDEYIYPDAKPETLRRCAIAGYDIVIMGNTHYPLQLNVDGVLLLNPGSVGQPRNRNPAAQWAIIDTDTGEATLRSEPYDCNALVREARARHPDLPYLAEVLTRT